MQINEIENAQEESSKYRIVFRDPLSFSFGEEDIKVTLFEIKSGKERFFFASLEEESEYAKGKTYEIPFSAHTLEYLDNFAGESHVIHRIHRVSSPGVTEDFVIPCGRWGHKVLNIPKSKQKGKYIWEFQLGSIQTEYETILKSLKENIKQKLLKKI